MKDMNYKPLISVIVPIYNVENYLRRCVNSIINQTYHSLQIILVDDGSTDESAKICDIFQQEDRRIEVIHKVNGGLVSARKAGIQAATGDYITYVDSDDWIELNMYEELVNDMLQDDVDIITSGLFREYKGSSIKEFDKFPDGIYDLERINKEILPGLICTEHFYEAGINIHLYNKLISRKIALQNQLKVDDRIRIGDDAAFIYSCVLDAKKLVITHKCFYHYCIRQDSIMGQGYQEELLGYRSTYKIIKDKIEQHYGKSEMLINQLNYLMLYMLLLKEPQRVIQDDKGMLFPFDNVKVNEKVIIYGGGKFGSSLHRFLEEEDLCEIVLWVDKSADSKRGITDILHLKQLSRDSYDKIIVAVLVYTVADKIYRELIESGFEDTKIAKISMKILETNKINELKML